MRAVEIGRTVKMAWEARMGFKLMSSLFLWDSAGQLIGQPFAYARGTASEFRAEKTHRSPASVAFSTSESFRVIARMEC
jgi:hypothetical protein